jgi:hypothetical protein
MFVSYLHKIVLYLVAYWIAVRLLGEHAVALRKFHKQPRRLITFYSNLKLTVQVQTFRTYLLFQLLYLHK